MFEIQSRQQWVGSWSRWLSAVRRPAIHPAVPVRTYTASDGPWDVEIEDRITLAGRDHELSLRIYKPCAQGPLPVILFSHGVVAKREDYGPLGRFWASHGYLSIHPQHRDPMELTPKPSSFRRRFNEALKAPEMWRRRIGDLQLVLDSLHSRSSGSLGDLFHVETGRIGGAGHSSGADLMQLLAGAQAILPPPYGRLDVSDPRLKAALLLSPRGRDWMAPSRRCWRHADRPMMSMTGSHDLRARRRGGPSWQLEPIRFSPPGGKYGVNIDGANHLSFTLKIRDQTEVIAPRYRAAHANHGMIFDVIKVASLAFWDAHLKEDRAARAYLQTGGLDAFSNGAVQVECR